MAARGVAYRVSGRGKGCAADGGRTAGSPRQRLALACRRQASWHACAVFPAPQPASPYPSSHPPTTPRCRPQVFKFALQVASALHHLHSRGVLHLDIKPDNVFLDGHGEELGMRDVRGKARVDGVIRGIPLPLHPPLLLAWVFLLLLPYFRSHQLTSHHSRPPPAGLWEGVI